MTNETVTNQSLREQELSAVLQAHRYNTQNDTCSCGEEWDGPHYEHVITKLLPLIQQLVEGARQDEWKRGHDRGIMLCIAILAGAPADNMEEMFRTRFCEMRGRLLAAARAEGYAAGQAAAANPLTVAERLWGDKK